MTIADLKIGETAFIKDVKKDYNLKLLEMGFVPGNSVKIVYVGLGGSPIAIQILDYTLAIRLSEAKLIEIEYENNII